MRDGIIPVSQPFRKTPSGKRRCHVLEHGPRGHFVAPVGGRDNSNVVVVGDAQIRLVSSMAKARRSLPILGTVRTSMVRWSSFRTSWTLLTGPAELGVDRLQGKI
jgi:hypothetical protein